MSFIMSPVETKYISENNMSCTKLPYQYLSSAKPENSWYLPGDTKNQTVLNANNIQTNLQYRKYMTQNGNDIILYNQKEYKKQSIR